MPEDTDPSLSRWRRWLRNHQRGVVLAGLGLLLVTVLLLAQATPSIAPRANETRDVVTLREYIDVRLNALEEKVHSQDVSRQLAIDKAESGITTRLQGFPATFVTKDEFTARVDAITSRINVLENRSAGLDGEIKIFGLIFTVSQVFLGVWLSKRITVNGGKRKSDAHNGST